MEIKRIGSVPSGKGPADYFTGTVRVDLLFDAPDPARVTRRQRHLRARRPHRLAHASARPDADRHLRLRPGAALGRSHRGDPSGRRDLVRAGRKALARRSAGHGDDPHRHSGKAQRQNRRLDGTGERRAISSIACWSTLRADPCPGSVAGFGLGDGRNLAQQHGQHSSHQRHHGYGNQQPGQQCLTGHPAHL